MSADSPFSDFLQISLGGDDVLDDLAHAHAFSGGTWPDKSMYNSRHRDSKWANAE